LLFELTRALALHRVYRLFRGASDERFYRIEMQVF
jgi:hypothetical protein